MDGHVLVDVQQIIPPPEAADYQVQIREKREQERQARTSSARDFTRYDVLIEGEKYTSQWKRNAIFIVCKHLCDLGVNPEEIASLFNWRSNHVWFAVDGEFDASAFEKRAAERASLAGSSFNTGRWMCEDGKLVQANGKTYAFSSQWGGVSWLRAMNLLKEKYTQFHIEFSATEA